MVGSSPGKDDQAMKDFAVGFLFWCFHGETPVSFSGGISRSGDDVEVSRHACFLVGEGFNTWSGHADISTHGLSESCGPGFDDFGLTARNTLWRF
ncbi:hypothetical protein DY000_02012474 [Brassica cretica]|uniref:Uncharacterized protein n=1 Tax=Brassica cretica TaxID=69181 RepID=A0ABQ7CWY8_BRACR|nr:hypothetical protein DY000_02012474 [Brassica cretica]